MLPPRCVALVGLLAMPFALSACDDAPPPVAAPQSIPTSGAEVVGTPGEPSPQMAHVRAIHASPDPLAAAVVVYLDNQTTPVISSLGFRSAVGYRDIAAVQHTVQVRLPGIPATTPPQLSWTTPVLQADHTYTIVAIGLALEAPAVTFVLDEDPGTLADAGHANVRFMDAYVGAPSIELCGNDGTALFSDVGYGTFGAAGGNPDVHYAMVPAGTANLIVRMHGHDGPCTGHPLGAVNVPLQDRANQTLIVVGREVRRGTGNQAVAPQVLSCQDAPLAGADARCATLPIVSIPGMH